MGGGAQVLGSPVKAMRRLVGELERYGCEPLRAGEFVSTGTLTQALPATPGGLWRRAPGPPGHGQDSIMEPRGSDRYSPSGVRSTKSVVPWSRSTALIV